MESLISLRTLYDIIFQYWPVYPAVFIAGIVDAIGGGGGLITLPVYMLVGLSPHQAIGTNKMSSCMGTAIATYRFAKEGYINWKTALFAVAAALAGSYTGANLSLLISNHLFKILMLFILPLTAFFVLRTKDFDAERKPYGFRKTCVLCCVTAFLIGAYDGFYGPGTGTFLILLLTSVAHLSLKGANGLTKVINMTSNITSLAVFLYNGTVLAPLGILAGVCNMAGNWIGVSFFDRKGGAVVKPVILLVLGIFLVKTILELTA
ncbi:MAG: sulfite exporter TauE/SafE family protein [Oscillospiraceae bacterium]|nr:sulfite exporter TauE/SafE family protein [Oscillospiraceae bacterium]